ncbi:hypothetical protein F8M41_010056 [Gigaspora margarita]|uniref:Uncharacterized protein n=1 Tax=Gigaspora margarita TaxID=4874 RepID=A0A8H4A2M9_GIGMA|nr:hypothetical protein F8M41_010056 [Gigaspora margarita]
MILLLAAIALKGAILANNTAPQSSTVSLLLNGRVSKDHRSKLRGLHDQTNSKQFAKKKVKKKSEIAEYAQYQTGGQASRQQVSPLSSGFLLQSQQNQTNNFDSSSGVIGQAVKFPICSNIVLGNPAFGLASHNAQSGVPLQGSGILSPLSSVAYAGWFSFYELNSLFSYSTTGHQTIPQLPQLSSQVNDSLGNWDPTTLVLSPDQDYSLQGKDQYVNSSVTIV